MRSARLVVLAVAVVAAAGAGYIAMSMSAAPPPVVETAAPAPQIELRDVLVATENLGVGTEVRDQMRWQSWPAEAISDGYITRSAEPQAMDELKGSTVRLQFMAGEPIRKAKLIGPGQSFMSAMLPPGMRAVATQISADTSAGGFILPNDFVDVIMTRRQEGDGGGRRFLTETILENIRVLAIDQAIQEDEKGNKVIVGQTATLEVTPQQAEIITVAQQMADRLSLALRSTLDAQEPAEKEADYLVSAPGRRGTVKLIKSGTVIEVGAK
ncbi:Flp pilus assembly protein CpaB [Paramesorhizobium deserti]|uniref:Flp pilus assembly protein CpaB n=1 Tax=Paramesorhizobium deserti TaxID=1494590 RepID=A0A135I0V4_9HYPH|nr:Flp pilus assembly protein CpaB [Paramesorhizobium deserti]KXF79038.1 Flp pilus assembly protein CpaB [Paramesorhizobium deserti]